MQRVLAVVLVGVVAWLAVAPVPGQGPAYTRTRDVIYGRKFGLALTLDVFAPKKANGVGVVSVISGGWRSNPESIYPAFYTELLKRGYTVFAVVHGSQPRFTIDSCHEDITRSVRFIRANAKKFGIDPEKLGIMGASAGGHLSLMQGTAGTNGALLSGDPVERTSSKVQAVGCFFPPTDFLNWGKPGAELIGPVLQPPFTAAVDYYEFDRRKARWQPITDKERLRELTKKMSPITHVNKTSAPALLVHGDKDDLVPLQQSETMVERLKTAGVPARLVVRKGMGHGWRTIIDDMALIADWFDEHLRKGKAKGAE